VHRKYRCKQLQKEITFNTFSNRNKTFGRHGEGPMFQHLKGLSTVFAGPLVQQKIWPLYFETKEAAGKAMQNGYKDLWSTFIIAVSSSSEIRRVAAVRFLHLS
jgi:hypothetical protein